MYVQYCNTYKCLVCSLRFSAPPSTLPKILLPKTSFVIFPPPCDTSRALLSVDKTRSIVMDYAGKSCIVTGAARGIGRAITEALLQRGAKVLFVDVLWKVDYSGGA